MKGAVSIRADLVAPIADYRRRAASAKGRTPAQPQLIPTPGSAAGSAGIQNHDCAAIAPLRIQRSVTPGGLLLPGAGFMAWLEIEGPAQKECSPAPCINGTRAGGYRGCRCRPE